MRSEPVEPPPPPLSYAPQTVKAAGRRRQVGIVLGLFLLWICGALALSLTSLFLSSPRGDSAGWPENGLLGATLGYAGLAAVILSLPAFLVAAVLRYRGLILLGILDVLLALVWVGRALAFLRYL